MRLLVLNTRYAPAYIVIRSLRPHAERIVATMSGLKRMAWMTCHAAYSRLVDKRYRVPSPERDWREGHIQAENTEREEAFVSKVLEICKREKIDTIFPSSDAFVYVISKNKERFESLGITVPVPDYETVLRPLDKYQAVQAASAVGFPHPRTYLAETDAVVHRAIRELDPPWVIKPRFTLGSQGLAILDREADVLEQTRVVRKSRGTPIIQEYIPGNSKQNFYIVMDRSGEVRSIFAPKIVRYNRRIFRTGTAACESTAPRAYSEDAIRFAQHLGWWGGLTIQTKIDARDGLPKLMEANPRLGSSLWLRTELGIDEPWMCVQIARGQQVETVTDYPLGCLMLDPVEDLIGLPFEILDLLIFRFRTGILGRQPIDPSAPPTPLREMIRTLRNDYLNPADKRYRPQFKHGLEDPVPLALWGYLVLSSYLRGARLLGK